MYYPSTEKSLCSSSFPATASGFPHKLTKEEINCGSAPFAAIMTQAMLLLANLAAVAAIDLKPQYHFTRNANEMNDPNGLMMHVEFTPPPSGLHDWNIQPICYLPPTYAVLPVTPLPPPLSGKAEITVSKMGFSQASARRFAQHDGPTGRLPPLLPVQRSRSKSGERLGPRGLSGLGR